MKEPLRVTILGLSPDLGLFAKTDFYAHHGPKFWFFLLQIVPALVLWSIGTLMLNILFFHKKKLIRSLQRKMSHRLFSFLLSKDNMHEHKKFGYLKQLEDKYNRPVMVSNISQIGNSFKMALRNSDRIPEDQDIVFIHLGAMELYNKLPCNIFRSQVRELLTIIARKNPKVHIIFAGLPESVAALCDPFNHQKCAPLPFAPTITYVQRMEGFLNWGVHPHCDDATVQWAYKLQSVYVEIITHELRRSQRLGLIHSFTYIDNRQAPLFAPEERAILFSVDGVHPTGEGHRRLASYGWPLISQSLDDSGLALERS